MPLIRQSFVVALAVALSLAVLGSLPSPHYINVSLDSEVTEASVAPVVLALYSATPDDTVVISINSPGGDVQAGMQILDAMKGSKAKDVIVSVGQFAASMAAEIAQEAPVMEVTPESIVLIHTISIQNPVTGDAIKILPYSLNEFVNSVDPSTANSMMLEARYLFVQTCLNSFGLWGPQALFDVAEGQDVTELAGGHMWGRVDPTFAKGNFDILTAMYNLDVPSDSRADDFLTGIVSNKLLSLTYHVVLVNLD